MQCAQPNEQGGRYCAECAAEYRETVKGQCQDCKVVVFNAQFCKDCGTIRMQNSVNRRHQRRLDDERRRKAAAADKTLTWDEFVAKKKIVADEKAPMPRAVEIDDKEWRPVRVLKPVEWPAVAAKASNEGTDKSKGQKALSLDAFVFGERSIAIGKRSHSARGTLAVRVQTLDVSDASAFPKLGAA